VVDTRTGLLARVTHHRDPHSWDERLDDWKPSGGRRRWTTSESGDPALFAAGYERQNVDSVDREPPRDPAAFSPPASSLRPVAWLRARGVARLPFHYRRGSVWVRAALNRGPPADYILGTGCTMSAVDREQAREAGLETEGEMATEGVGGVGTGGWAQVRSLRIAGPDGDGVEVRDLKVGVLELADDMERLDWDDAAGLIGYDVLSRFMVEIDFDPEQLVLRDPATFHYAGAGQPLPFTLHACIPTVEVVLNGTCHGRLLVDVGNATVMSVHCEQVDTCHLFGGDREEIQHWVGGIGGAFPETVCRLDSVRIGPLQWSEPVVGLTLHHLGEAGSRELQGNLGTSVLERFRCTFDYARGTLWLEPGRRYALRDHFSSSGLIVARRSGRIWVAGVVRHSPAADAGLQVDDLVKAVNGRPIERWTPEELQALFEEGPADTTVHVTVERELVDRDLELTLADVL